MIIFKNTSIQNQTKEETEHCKMQKMQKVEKNNYKGDLYIGKKRIEKISQRINFLYNR